jgi:hypothetical protein
MSVNQHRPHVFVVPEDNADRQIANGFLLHQSLNARAIQVLPPCGGWKKVVDSFHRDHKEYMHACLHRFLVLVVDFDRRSDRFSKIVDDIPEPLRDRVFVLGAQKEPEELRKANLGSFEEIGKRLADDCYAGERKTWGHALLKHNAAEIARMYETVRPILFADAPTNDS